MYQGSIPHDRIINAFERAVPGCYVRDYRERGGFIVICRQYRDIKWRDQLSTSKVERQVPAVTLVNLPKGSVTAATLYHGMRLHRPGWRQQFRKAMAHLSDFQMRTITKMLKCGEVFPGVMA
jgi:hypothetical protein